MISQILEAAFISGLIGAMMRMATPIIFATLGEILAERSGVLNLGIEGIMLMGAMTGFLVSISTGSLWFGVFMAALVGMALGLLMAFLSVHLGLSQHVSGLGITLFAAGLAMFIYGEFNTFRPADARGILGKAHAALAGGGVILLEPHTFDMVRQLGQQPPSWYSAPSGLFSDRPHVCLEEHFWDAASQTATTRFFIVDAATGEVAQHASTTRAYTDEEYRSALRECGFEEVRFSASLTGVEEGAHEGLFVITGRKARGREPDR